MSRAKADDSAAPRDRSAEHELIQRAQRRDPAAMRKLIDLHKERLFAFVWRTVRNHHDAEEICQEAFLKAFAALDGFDPTYRFSTWLFTIAYRVALNSTRRKKAVSGDVDLTLFSDDSESAEEQAVNSEEAKRLKKLVWEAVDRLTPPQKAAVLLFYKQQQSCQEIAEVLDIPVATVKSHLHRARTKMRDILAPEMGTELGTESQRDRILGELAG